MRERSKLEEIQILRAVAALAVVIDHIGLDLRYWAKATMAWTDAGNSGVDLFFVISGFIMIYISWERFGLRGAPLDFFGRRLIRIVPLYWLLTTAFVVANSYPGSRIITSYLFVPDLTASAAALPVILQGWTLNFEMMFYAVLAAALFLPRLIAMGCVSAVLLAIVLAGVPYYGNTIVLEFVLGMWIGFAYRSGVSAPAGIRIAAIVIGVAAIGASIFVPHQDRLMAFGIPAALIVSSATLGAPIRSSRAVRAMVLIGDASYALYLTHPLMTRLSATAIRHVFGLDSVALQSLCFVVAIASSVALALVVYIGVERPITATLHRLWTRRRFAMAPAPHASP